MKNALSSDKRPFLIWALYHGLIIIAFLFSLFFTKGVNFSADFTKMMPSSSTAFSGAGESILQNSGNTVFILSSHKDFSKAKEGAVRAYALLKDETSKFNSVELYTGADSFSDVQDFIRRNRFFLLDKETRDLLNTDGGPEAFAQEALSSVFSAFSFTSPDFLEEDPFLFDQVNLEHYLKAVTDSGTKLSPKDGVLAREFEGKWYVMLRASLTEEGARLASKKNAVPFIYQQLLPFEKDGLSYVFYGSAFHGYKSSSSASAEISVISTVSLIAVIIILLAVFRSALPLFASLFSIFCSVLTALCATHLVFGQIYMTSLVFGTSLIGSCIDYSLHYFTSWKACPALDSPLKIRRHLFNGLILSLVSTELCFAFLFAAPFDLLKQMAVFSFTGLLSSFLTVTGFFTLFKLPPSNERKIPLLDFLTLRLSLVFSVRVRKILSASVPLFIFASTLCILAFNHSKVKIRNDISNLYKMEGRLRDDTVTAYQVLDYSPSSFLVLSADTEEELLQKEEEICLKIPDPYIASSRFIPSIRTQKESLKAAEKLLPLAPEQYETLGFEASSAADFAAALKTAGNSFMTVNDSLPSSLKSLITMLWPGKKGDRFYSIILPSSIKDESFYRSLVASDTDIHFENKVKDISLALDRLTKMVLMMFLAAFLIISIIIKFFYSWRDTLKIVSIPVLSVLVIVSVFVLSGLKIEFFCITGIILVFGMGLDYIIYRMENKGEAAESFAIALSFITTAVSFGSLALSSFVPVHVIGLSIFSGLVTAFICAVL